MTDCPVCEEPDAVEVGEARPVGRPTLGTFVLEQRSCCTNCSASFVRRTRVAPVK